MQHYGAGQPGVLAGFQHRSSHRPDSSGVRRILRHGITAVIAATSLGIATMTAGAAGAAAPGGTFVALGDSYAAGNLIPASPAGTPAGCLRSTHNYSGDVQAVIRAGRYVDAACTDA